MKNTRKILLFTMITAVLFVAFVFGASAVETTGQCGPDVSYSFDENTGKLTVSGAGDMYNYSYNRSPFYDSDEITEAIIEEGVTGIGENAFRDCYALETVTIAESVSDIGKNAFQNCESLKSVTIPEGVADIEEYTFWGCGSLESAILPQTLKNIGEQAFSGCYSLKNVDFYQGLESIAEKAFYNTAIKSINIPASVTYIDKYAFDYCTSLESVTVDGDNYNYSSDEYGVLFDKNKTELLMYPKGNKRESYTVPATVTKIGMSAFAHSCYIKEIIIPGSVNEIGNEAFFWCEGLDKITLPKGITKIGDYTFYCCEGLEKATLSSGITKIGQGAFMNCRSLKAISLPDGVAEIADNAFINCEEMKDISIPDSVINIGNDAFSGTAYHGDESNWKNKVLYISNHIIDVKKDITGKYKIEEGTRSIAAFAFSNCAELTEIEIPESLAGIGSGAFRRCGLLWNIVVSENNSSFLSVDGVLFNKNKTELIQYPIRHARTEYEIPDGVTRVGDYAFEVCYAVEKIAIPDSVASFGMSAFADCINLADVIIPEGVTRIEEKTFYNCFELKSVTVPESVEFIDAEAFSGCGNLTDVYYPGDVYDFEEIEMEYGNEVLFEANIHSASDKEPEHSHSYTSEIFTEPTCGYEGIRIFICSCGDSYSEPIDPTGQHIFTNACDSECNECGETRNITHSYTLKSTRQPSCSVPGSKVFACLCGKSYTETVKATGKHTGGKATCKVKAKCSVCKQYYGSFKSHTYKTVITKATLKKNGRVQNKCSVCGYVSKTTTVYYPKTIKLSTASYTYNGKARTPFVTVKDSKGKTLKKGTDYTVKFSPGRKAIGKYTVTVTFKGKYSGTKKLTYEIVPAKVTLSKLTATSKQLTATWKTLSGITGYEIEYSTSSKFTSKTTKKVTVKSSKTKKTTIKKLTKGKKYYVRIRAYKTVNKKPVYGAWSAVKSIKVK